MPAGVSDQLDQQTLEQAQQFRSEGWAPHKALAPPAKTPFVRLPPIASQEAHTMREAWERRYRRQGHDWENMPFEKMQGRREEATEGPAPEGRGDAEREETPVAVVMQSHQGEHIGQAGQFAMEGLSVGAMVSLRVLVFVNFFGGQRRDGDIPHWIEGEQWIEGGVLFALTVDICIDAEMGDLLNTDNADKWKNWILSGQILGGGCGPPCESWSAARFRKDGPPPLRSAEALYGLEGLKAKQAKQVYVANRLLAFAIDAAWWFAAAGGCFFLEHPQYACWLGRPLPSIWRLEPIRLLKRLHCVSVISFDQCTLGAPSRKPTTLLLVRLPGVRDSIRAAGDHGRCHHARGAHLALVGREARGAFRTAAAKEYPPGLCQVVARGFVQHARSMLSLGADVASQLPTEWELWHQGIQHRLDAIQPDFAG